MRVPLCGLLLLVTVTGCGPQMRNHPGPPQAAPRAVIDLEASQVTVVNATNAEDVRKWITEVLDQDLTARPGRLLPARFEATVQAEAEDYPYGFLATIALPVIGLLLPIPLGKVSAEVELILEIDGRRHQGRGRDEQTKYFAASASDLYFETALRHATQLALADAFKQLSVAQAQRKDDQR